MHATLARSKLDASAMGGGGGVQAARRGGLLTRSEEHGESNPVTRRFE